MPAGQPMKFKSPEEMQAAIDEYFDYCDNRIKQVYDKNSGTVIEVLHPAPYTILGLCRVLEIDRKTLLNYEKRTGYEEFFHTVKKAKAKIAEDVEKRSFEGSPAGAIFNLKNNFGYKDKTEQDHNHNFPNKIKMEFIKSDNGHSDSETT